jgi:hypothetical protein
MNTEDFIKKANTKHNNKFSYEKSKYVRFHDKLTIICDIHGEFEQSPYVHLRGSGCPHCYGNKKLTTTQFIKKAQKVHGNKYNYDSSVYSGNKGSVIIQCPKHGEFMQRATRHLSGDGCPTCSRILITNKNTKTTPQFISESKQIHKNKYSYSECKYVGYNIPVTIICLKHGKFEQKPTNHLQGKGCPICKESKGENSVRTFLNENNIKFEKEKTFTKCKGSRQVLPFDFYLPEHNILIEYDGRQHFEPVDAFGGEIQYEETKKNDSIKNDFALENKIPLYRIKYNENLEKKIK